MPSSRKGTASAVKKTMSDSGKGANKDNVEKKESVKDVAEKENSKETTETGGAARPATAQIDKSLNSPTKDASTDPFDESGSKTGFEPFPDLIKTEELKDLLECPVCLRVPRASPIFQCARGHVVCCDCRPNVSTCPQCRDPLGNIRSLVSEKMLEKLPCVCKFGDNGCQVELLRSQLPQHERSCTYRLINCVDLACQQRVAVSKLLAHLDTDHETEDFVRVEGGEYNSHFIVNEEDFTKSIMWISDQLHYDEKYFYRECCRSKEGLWYIWIYLLETENCKVTDYTCTISIKSADGEEELMCRCPPLSLDFTKENLAESGRGLVFTDTTARLFWEDNKVRYNVVISSKKPPVPVPD